MMGPLRRFFMRNRDAGGSSEKSGKKEKTVKCGFCSLLSALLRRALCLSSGHNSESYCRELGDQDTLIEDRVSYNSEDLNPAELQFHLEVHHPPENVTHEADMITKALDENGFLTINKKRRKILVTRCLLYHSALLDDLYPGQVRCMLAQAAKWRFNAFTLDTLTGGRCLPVLCFHLFQTYDLFRHFKLDPANVWRLFSMIEDGYHSRNPYHNSIHAADVTQAMHCFLQQERIKTHMEPLEIMASLLAAIAHDLDHPGVNQPFLIATSNHLASLYQNTSVLENHHWRAAVSCLIESRVLDHMEGSRVAVQQHMSALIMATDITKQQDYLTRFKSSLDDKTLDMTKADNRLLVLQIALKCADISNPCRSWYISQKWSLKVCEEFFRQGDTERRLNLPVTALCDRHTLSIPKIQTGFFKFVVTPLIKEWDRFLNNDVSAQMFENLVYNQNQWDLLAKETSTEITATDMVEEDIETTSSANVSDSSEQLLPPRRCSLNPPKAGAFKEQLRRFSVPLIFKNKLEKSRTSSRKSSQKDDNDSEVSIRSEISAAEQAQVEPEKVLNAEIFLPDPSTASISTTMQATRVNTVIKGGVSWKLLRQQTFPPLEPSPSPIARSLHKNSEGTISRFITDLPSFVPNQKESGSSNLPKKIVTDNTPIVTYGSQNSLEVTVPPIEREPKRRQSLEIGSQFRSNLTSIQLRLDPDHLLGRRKSMPSNELSLSPKEKKTQESTSVLPQFLWRTLSGKESWTHRRGSAPSPVATSEFRGLLSVGSICHSPNGGKRKPNPMVLCQQWLAKTTYNVQEISQHPGRRRGSLPVDVLTGKQSP